MNNKYKPYVMLIPVMIVILGIFINGLIMAFIQSLGYFKAIGLTEITFKYYKEVLTSQGFLSSLGFSVYIATISSVIAVVLGVILAYSILRSTHRKGIEEAVYKLPIFVPHIVVALLAYNILAQSGVLPRVLYSIGIIKDQSQFPSLLYDKNGIGIIIAYIWKGIPFVAMVVYTILSNINNKLSQVALNLGANNRQVFFYILLPLIIPSILSSFIIIFAFSFGAYELPFLLGPTSPKALPVKAYVEYTNSNLANRPYAMVINMILTIVSLILVWLYNKSFELISKYNR